MVGRGFSAYERELKDLLQGERAVVAQYARALAPTERTSFHRIIQEPFLVVRAAGSLGFDLIALRRELSLPFEVKASHEATIHFSAAGGRAQDQLTAHRSAVERVGLTALYAYRRLGHRGGDPWRLFAAARLPEKGSLRFLARRLPPVETTREGNAVLRWENGMPLAQFVATVHSLFESTGTPAT